MAYTRTTPALLAAIAFGCCLSGCAKKDGREHFEIAVTNSYLACVVEDLCGPEMKVLCLAPPGMCPGHFDISPGQVAQLRQCKMFILFDFQKSLEKSLSRMQSRNLTIVNVTGMPGLCTTGTYLEICNSVRAVLSQCYPDKISRLYERMSAIEQRLKNLNDEIQTKVSDAGLSNATVLSSDHQVQFCEWLGLEPVATFAGSDIETVANINECLKKAEGRDVRFVIANRQEGSALAEALARRIGAEVVVFSNFPEVESDKAGFDELLRANVRALIEAAAQ